MGGYEAYLELVSVFNYSSVYWVFRNCDKIIEPLRNISAKFFCAVAFTPSSLWDLCYSVSSVWFQKLKIIPNPTNGQHSSAENTEGVQGGGEEQGDC